MEKMVFDALQLLVIGRIVYSLVKWSFRSKKKKGKGITKKVRRLISNRIHYYLDNAIKKQKKVLHGDKAKEIALPSNVIPFRKTR